MTSEESTIQLSTVQKVKQVSEDNLLVMPNVVGVGVGYKETKGKDTSTICIHVYVDKKLPKKELTSNSIVPSELDNVKTDVREVGYIEALAFKSRIRPTKPGYSIGHYKISAGTFGCLVKDACSPCRTYILGNNHVLANSNASSTGDPILQPGKYDGGSYPADLVARLSRFVPILFNQPKRYNLVDAALAIPMDLRKVTASVAGLGIPRGTVEATLGMDVIKSGRTTGTTVGKVIGVDATIAVNYGVGIGYFRSQTLTTDMSEGGDSGSLLMSRKDRKATGLLFAGSSKVTIHNNITNVLMALGVEIITA